MKYLAIIPARIGSKRINQKNLMPLNGIPLVEWTLRAAKGSSQIEEIYVSSDSDAIINLGAVYGAKAFGKRPPHLARDDTSTFDVVTNVLELYKNRSLSFESIVLLQPTSPLRNAQHIREAIHLFEENGKKPLQSYSPAECPPQWLFKVGEDHRVMRTENLMSARSQDLGMYYRINGAIYILTVEDLLKYKTFTPADSIAYIMNRTDGIDIDEPVDAELAAFFLKSDS